MTQATEISAGQVVSFSSGEYSDYHILAFARVLKSLNSSVWESMILACTLPYEWDLKGNGYFHDDKAIPWLIANGYIEEIPYTELHLSDYSRPTPWSEA